VVQGMDGAVARAKLGEPVGRCVPGHGGGLARRVGQRPGTDRCSPDRAGTLTTGPARSALTVCPVQWRPID